MDDATLDQLVMADTLRYIARYRAETIRLGEYKTAHRSRDNVASHDGHRANTYRRFPRTNYSNPVKQEGTSPGMRVTLPDGTVKVVPHGKNWRKHLKTDQTVHQDTLAETARRGGTQADYD